MLHDFINSQEITRWSKGWDEWYEIYESVGIENMRKNLLLRRNRRENPIKFLNDISRIYKIAQRQYKEWRVKYYDPILSEARERAVDGKIFMHAKPNHNYKVYRGQTWWKYKYDYSPKPYGWGYTFDWVDEPEEKINHDLGQALYEADRKSQKYNHRVFILEKFFQKELEKYLYSLYSYDWLHQNQFSEKLVKFNLLGDEYWYKISHSKNGVPVWENFIWQSNNTEEINL
jgi:hypothetical protein